MKKIKHLCTLLIISLFCLVSYADEDIFFDAREFVNINVYDKLFSPNGDGIFDELIFEISFVQDKLKIKSWQLDIVDLKTNKIVHVFSGTKEIPKTLKWDGFQDGNAIEGNYKYIFTALINKKKVQMQEDGIAIDITSPYVSLNCAPDTVIIDKENNQFLNNIIFTFNIGDENKLNLNKTKLQILSFNDKVIKEWTFQNYDVIPQNISWDGKDDIYGRVVHPGEYKAVLVSCDIVNNGAKIYKNITAFEQLSGSISEIVVKEEPRGLVVNLSSNILFPSASAILKEEASGSLSETVKLLEAYPANKVLIEGYTDSTGKKSKNLQLSYDRAQAVYLYFVQNGIQAERLQTVGYGEENPVASNKTAKGRALNRRVNIVILKNENTTDENITLQKN